MLQLCSALYLVKSLEQVDKADNTCHLLTPVVVSTNDTYIDLVTVLILTTTVEE